MDFDYDYSGIDYGCQSDFADYEAYSDLASFDGEDCSDYSDYGLSEKAKKFYNVNEEVLEKLADKVRDAAPNLTDEEVAMIASAQGIGLGGRLNRTLNMLNKNRLAVALGLGGAAALGTGAYLLGRRGRNNEVVAPVEPVVVS